MTRQEISALFDKAESMRDYPGSYFPAMQRARRALADWTAANPEAAAREDAERAEWLAEEKARREYEYKNSFIGRGLD